ncbi:hypothetical protein PGT21_002696 [Puccinia graminis f. sp. tritici]|uniref:Uncharacterized protein n=1 Tax=Puccinia graminis f. sp. tritici TaxID=56615 RepID=A0A5B0LSE9_PUCGR|nr:hypothetical protein PGT21_002696 [Puccinia graminis f. sp. tritici]KAA1137854.1 hypothetical protein PGTUg99_025853 [Puccinia graminis f. sp. tritici]
MQRRSRCGSPQHSRTNWRISNDQPASARAPAKNRNSITGLPLRHSTSTPLTDCRNIDWNDSVAMKAYFTTNNRHMLPPVV